MKVMRNEAAPKVEKKSIPDGSYRVRVVKVEEKSRKPGEVVAGGKKPYAALRVSFAYVSPKYKEFYSPTAMVFLSSDEQSSFIQTGSRYDKWMQALTGLQDYSAIDPLTFLKGREVVVKVKTDKYTNVVDIYLPKEKDSESSGASRPEAGPALVQKTTHTTPVRTAPVVQKDEFVEEGEELEPVAVGDDDDL